MTKGETSYPYLGDCLTVPGGKHLMAYQYETKDEFEIAMIKEVLILAHGG